MHGYAGNGKTTLCSSLLCMAMLVMERQRCVQVCYVGLCWYWKDDVVFKFVMHVNASIGKTTLCSSLLCRSMPVLERQRVQVCYACLCW